MGGGEPCLAHTVFPELTEAAGRLSERHWMLVAVPEFGPPEVHLHRQPGSWAGPARTGRHRPVLVPSSPGHSGSAGRNTATEHRVIPARTFVGRAALVVRLSPPHASPIDAPRVFDNARASVSPPSSGVWASTGAPAICAGLFAAKPVFRTVHRVNARVVPAVGSGQPGQSRGFQSGRFPGQAADRPTEAASGSRGSGGRRASPPGCRGRRSRSSTNRDRPMPRRGRGRAR